MLTHLHYIGIIRVIVMRPGKRGERPEAPGTLEIMYNRGKPDEEGNFDNTFREVVFEDREIYLSLYLSISLSIYLSIYMNLSLSLSIHIYIYIYIDRPRGTQQEPFL